jgi:hypothetical protein
MDIATFVEAATGLKTALDSLKILRGLKGVSGDKTAQEEISKLHEIIVSAQQSAITANLSQLEIIQQNRALEEKLAQFERWDHEKTRYQLRDVNPGRGSVFVWALKPGVQDDEPFHVLCTRCFEQRRRSIIQGTADLRKAQRVHICLECKSEYVFGAIVAPDRPAKAISEYDPDRGM